MRTHSACLPTHRCALPHTLLAGLQDVKQEVEDSPNVDPQYADDGPDAAGTPLWLLAAAALVLVALVAAALLCGRGPAPKSKFEF